MRSFGVATFTLALAVGFPGTGAGQLTPDQVARLGGAWAADLSPEEAKIMAVEAYIFNYPLVTMDVTRRVMSNVPAGVKTGIGPMGMFHHFRTYPTADFRDVVRPNFDTLYSVAWLDMTKEPMVVSVPDSGGRYYLMPLYDMWTDAYAVPGKRTNGTAAHDYAVTPPGWKGTLPAGLEQIESPTATPLMATTTT